MSLSLKNAIFYDCIITFSDVVTTAIEKILCLKAPYFYLGCRELVCPIRAILEKINVGGAKHTSGGIMLVFFFFFKNN